MKKLIVTINFLPSATEIVAFLGIRKILYHLNRFTGGEIRDYPERKFTKYN